MTRPVLAMLLASCAAAVVFASDAGAAERKPLGITVQKRSIFDLGNVVPVGSLNRYATQSNYASPAYSNVGERYGEGTLPPRIGAGSNPFANSWSSPRF